MACVSDRIDKDRHFEEDLEKFSDPILSASVAAHSASHAEMAMTPDTESRCEGEVGTHLEASRGSGPQISLG